MLRTQQDEDAVNVGSVELESNFAQVFFSLLASGGSAAVVGVDHVAGSSPGHGCGPTSGALSHPWSFVESLRCAGSTTPAVYETHPH